jgi:hypothetical protein
MIRVSPSPKEKRELLTHNDTRHHHHSNMKGKLMIKQVHVQSNLGLGFTTR